MPDLMKSLPISETELKDIMNKVKAAEKGTVQLHQIAGVSKEELQSFLEKKAGLSPEEESQGSPFAAAVSIAMHC